MNPMEVSRQIVNVFYKRREKVEDYVVRLDFAPNPLNYDGCDQVSASVVRLDRISDDFNVPKAETVVLTHDYAWTIEEALTKLAERAGVSV